MNIYDIASTFTTKEDKQVNLEIKSFLWCGNLQHEVSVIFYYDYINKIVVYLMPLSLYEKCKNDYGDDNVKVIFHLPVTASDIEESK
jgi:hypothetical protein